MEDNVSERVEEREAQLRDGFKPHPGFPLPTHDSSRVISPGVT